MHEGSPFLNVHIYLIMFTLVRDVRHLKVREGKFILLFIFFNPFKAALLTQTLFGRHSFLQTLFLLLKYQNSVIKKINVTFIHLFINGAINKFLMQILTMLIHIIPLEKIKQYMSTSDFLLNQKVILRA